MLVSHQETDTVAVERTATAAPTTAAAVDWARLRTRVHAWKDSIGTIMSTFARSRGAEAAPVSILQRM